MRGILSTHTLAGVPLSNASIGDLNRALNEARREHIENNTPIAPTAGIITVYPGNAKRTAKALREALADEDITALIEELSGEK